MAASGSPGTTKEAASVRAQETGQDQGWARAQDPGPGPPLLWFLGILRRPLHLEYLNMGPKLLMWKNVPWSLPTTKSLSSYKIDMANTEMK